jgi:hypothetical protein
VTKDELDKIKIAANAATPGPWKGMQNPERKVVFIVTPKGILDHDIAYEKQLEDVRFIALSRTAVPELIAEVESLRSGYLTDEHGNEYVQVCILKEKIREQEAEIERLRDALKFYAAHETYWGKDTDPFTEAFPIDEDEGKIANAALEIK